MKLYTPALILGSMLLGLANASFAESFKGKIVGHDCAHKGETCPLDRLDPHVTLERDFVLSIGDDYYFLPNLPRDVKVRHVLEEVSIEGTKNSRYNSIDVDKLRVTQKGKSTLIWTAEWDKQISDFMAKGLHFSEGYNAN